MVYGLLKCWAGLLNILTLGCKDFGFDGRFLMRIAYKQSIEENKKDWEEHVKLYPPKPPIDKRITHGKKLVFDDKTGELIQIDR